MQPLAVGGQTDSVINVVATSLSSLPIRFQLRMPSDPWSSAVCTSSVVYSAEKSTQHSCEASMIRPRDLHLGMLFQPRKSSFPILACIYPRDESELPYTSIQTDKSRAVVAFTSSDNSFGNCTSQAERICSSSQFHGNHARANRWKQLSLCPH